MIYSELYSAYYNAVARIIKQAIDHPVDKKELRKIVEKYAFGESLFIIEPAIYDEKWQILDDGGNTPICQVPAMPLTQTEKMWLNAISRDPRINLFTSDVIFYEDAEPLFTEEDYIIFDKYADGDPYTDASYRKNFRQILDAVRNNYALEMEMISSKGNSITTVIMPHHLEYSERDDKFRIIGTSAQYTEIINIGRVISCRKYDDGFKMQVTDAAEREPEHIVFEVYDKRKAMERVLLHFAHFKKQAEKTGEDLYRVTIEYEKEDETEIVIRILSFGPMIKVIEPESFIGLIRSRLTMQKLLKEARQ